MPVNFAFNYDDIYYDGCRRALIFIHQGAEVMRTNDNMSFEFAMKLLEESRIRITIDRLDTLKKSANGISEILDELLKLREEGGKNLVDLKYQLRKLNESLEVFEKDVNALMKEGRRLADESA